MGRIVGIFLEFIFGNFLEFLMVGVFIYFLLYLVIGNKNGLFWSFVLEGILSVSILVILSFVWVYLAIGF